MGMAELIIIAVVVLVIVVMARNMSSNRSGSTMSMKSEAIESAIDWKAVQHPDIQAEIQANRKINAIKRYRELTGVGLKEAKDAIEYFMAHGIPQKGTSHKLSSDESDAGLRDLIAEGKIEEAIEIYRQFAGVDKFTAKEAIEQLQREMRLNDKPDLDSSIESQPDPFNQKRSKS